MIDTEPESPAERHTLEKSRDTRGLRALVDRARLGSTDAFADAVTILHPLVYRWALTFARDIDEAEEITQETFVLIYRKLDQYRGESAVEGWVYLITRRVALARTRKTMRRQILRDSGFEMETVYNTDPGSRVDRQRIADYIRHFFTRLPPRQREVFDLVDLQGHDPVDVAGLLGMKAATVRANLFKARSSIRAHLMQNHPAWEEVSK
ncbi:MAG TPA: RNA polymerase sigma factor [Gemmatimonadaceae bacterium]